MNFHHGTPIALLLVGLALAFGHPIEEDGARKEEITEKAANESKVSSHQPE